MIINIFTQLYIYTLYMWFAELFFFISPVSSGDIHRNSTSLQRATPHQSQLQSLPILSNIINSDNDNVQATLNFSGHCSAQASQALFDWGYHHCTAISVREFLLQSEDWMVMAFRDASKAAAATPPPQLHRLAFESDNFRKKSMFDGVAPSKQDPWSCYSVMWFFWFPGSLENRTC
jgi:hypothetical protein